MVTIVHRRCKYSPHNTRFEVVLIIMANGNRISFSDRRVNLVVGRNKALAQEREARNISSQIHQTWGLPLDVTDYGNSTLGESIAFMPIMYKPASSSNVGSSWWSGESKEEMGQEEIVLKPQFPMQLPDCPVCWDSFDDGPRMPRLLHCGHTICQVCLEHLLFESGLGQRCVRCPECRGVCVWRGLHELPKNYILLRVLNSSASMHKPPELPPRPIQLPQLPFVSQILQLSSLIIEHIPGMIERKLWELGKLTWALAAMSVFLPLSFAHMVLAWSTAILGSFVFVWFSLGSMGLAVFMFSTWCCYTMAQFLIDLGLGRFHKIHYRAPCPYS